MADLWINSQIISRENVASLGAAHLGISEKQWAAIQSFLMAWWNDADFIEVHTSGSTGKPKNIRLPKTTIAASADKTIGYFDLQPGNKVLLCLPVQYIAGQLMLVRAIRGQLKIVATEPHLNPVAELQEPVRFAAMIPAQVSNALNDAVTQKRLAEIEMVLIGGAPMEPQLEKRLQTLPNRFFHSYGMTETATHVAVREIGKSDHNTALIGVQFSTDKRDCLVINADHLPEQITTNDLVELIDAQSFRWLGRIDNAIISGGLKHLPELLEQKIAPFIASSFYITGAPDESLGEKLVLMIEDADWSEAQLDQLVVQLKTVLTTHEVPKEIRFAEKFQRTATGKIVRVK